MQIFEKELSEIKPYENNPRNNDNAVPAVIASICEFGFKVPIVIDSDGVIVCGHTRYKAAQEIGLKTVPCVIADDLTPEQVKAFRLADNKVGELATWDFEKLELETAELETVELEKFGFENSDSDERIADIPKVTEDNYDKEPPKEPKAKKGDIYQLGAHRLMCGDSTDPAVIERLMNGVKADMLFTSPPYSDMREYNGGKDLSVSNIAKFIGAYKPYTDYQCVNLGIQRKNHEIVQYWNEYIAKAKECGYKLLAWNVWDKMECGSIGQQIRHEWIFVFGTDFYEINLTQPKKSKPIKAKRATTRRQADGSMKRNTKGDESHFLKQMESVVSIYPEMGKIRALHPATFPVELPAEYIKALTDEGDSVIEPFGGSGSTLIACEQLNRKCYMCELDPRYMDVIIDRWEKFTGQKARKIND